MNYVAKLNFGNALASKASPVVVGELVRIALGNQELWASIEPFALPPGVCGSKAFDQANIVRTIKEWDANNGGKINALDMSDRILWDYIYREMSKVFKTSHGRVLGLLENKSQENNDANANSPDIE